MAMPVRMAIVEHGGNWPVNALELERRNSMSDDHVYIEFGKLVLHVADKLILSGDIESLGELQSVVSHLMLENITPSDMDGVLLNDFLADAAKMLQDGNSAEATLSDCHDDLVKWSGDESLSYQP